MFREKIELKDLEKMDPEYRELLGRVVTIQADCEIGGPHLYVKDILPSAPTKVDQLVVARTAAEELDHYRKIARVGGDMGIDVSFVAQLAESEALPGCLSRNYQNLGRLFRFWISHRPRGPLPTGGISRLHLQTVGAHLAGDHERGNRSRRLRPEQDHRVGGQGRRSEGESPRRVEFLVCQGPRHVRPFGLHP